MGLPLGLGHGLGTHSGGNQEVAKGRVSGGAQAGLRPAFQLDRVCQTCLLGPQESLAHLTPHVIRATSTWATRALLSSCPSLPLRPLPRHRPYTSLPMLGSGATSRFVSPLPPPHPQDTLKYTFSFLQLEQGGS